MPFNADELSIIKIYSEEHGLNRDLVIADIRGALPYVNDQEILKLMDSTVRKALAMKNEDFADIDLSCALVDEEVED